MATLAEVQAEIAKRQQPKGVTQQDVQTEISRRQQLASIAAQPAPGIDIDQQPQIDPNILAQAQQRDPSLIPAPEIGVRTFVEPALAIATATPAAIAGGVLGAIATPFIGAERGAGIVEDVQGLAFQPKSAQGQAGQQALGEAVAGGLEAVTEFGRDIGVPEALLKPIGDLVFDETGNPAAAAIATAIPEAILARLGVRKTPRGAPDITPQRAREIQIALEASKTQGIDVLTSDIFQPKSIMSRLSQQFSERIPVIGVGGKRAKQQTQRIEALDRLDQSIPRVESADIVDSLNRSANKARVAAGKRIDSTITAMDQVGAVPVTNAVNRIDAALARLDKPGKLGNEALVTELNNLKQTLLEADQSFGSLREFRTDARAISDKVDPAGRSQLRSSDKALMDNVIRGLTDDLDSFVLGNSDARTLARYKRADQVYAQEARKLTKSRLKTVLDRGDVKPELVNNLLFSSSPSEVKLLFNNLDASGRQNARLSLYRRALDNATRQGEVSPQRFVSELGKLENNFDTFFRGQAKAELNGLKRLLETTGRAGEAAVVGPTGQALQVPGTTAVLAGAAVGNPAAIGTLLGASTIGLAARVYESAGVRNMLIQLGKAPKRSTLTADLKKSIPLVLAEANRGIEQEQQALRNSFQNVQASQ
jgi:hypothetical protein